MIKRRVKKRAGKKFTAEPAENAEKNEERKYENVKYFPKKNSPRPLRSRRLKILILFRSGGKAEERQHRGCWKVSRKEESSDLPTGLGLGKNGGQGGATLPPTG